MSLDALIHGAAPPASGIDNNTTLIGPLEPLGYRAYLRGPMGLDLIPLHQDILAVCTGLLKLEEMLKREKLDREIGITLSVQDPGLWNRFGAIDILSDVYYFATGSSINLKVIPAKIINVEPHIEVISPKSITLFSGGLDSYSGVLSAKKHFGGTFGCFINHSTTVPLVVKDLTDNELNELGIKTVEFHMQHNREMIQQLRGFCYIVAGSILALRLGTPNLVVSECGITKFQPPLLPSDVVTKTTHPFVVSQAKSLLDALYGKSPNIYEPNKGLTKAEIIANLDDPEPVRKTHSCRSNRWAAQEITQCGRCYGCLIKYSGELVAMNHSITKWACDILKEDIGSPCGWNAKHRLTSKSMLEAFQLLRFARDIVDDSLSPWTRESIDEFHNQDLFRRFGMDVIAAIHILYESGGVGRNRYLKKWHDESLEIVTPDQIDERIAEVRERRFKPIY